MNRRHYLRFPVPLALCLALLAAPACSQSLPKPSRTIFKCEANGKVTYSDEPCLGAKRIDAEPTRGMDSYSGKRRTGEDVRREQSRESIAQAIRPLTGVDARQFDALVRRQGLNANAQQECRQREREIIQLEKTETGANAALQSDLFMRRKRYKELRC
jgi:hypothetical protein